MNDFEMLPGETFAEWNRRTSTLVGGAIDAMKTRAVRAAATATIARPPEPREMAEAARRVVHVQRLFHSAFPKSLPRQCFAPCSGA